MTTKYAKARDVAGQWKSELRKVQRENRSLRKVYDKALALLEEMAYHKLVTGTELGNNYISLAARDLRSVMRAALFAQPQQTPEAQQTREAKSS